MNWKFHKLFIFSFIIKWTVNTRCFTWLHNDLHYSRHAYHLHYEHDDGLANGGNDVFGCAGDFGDYHLLREFTIQNLPNFFSWQNQIFYQNFILRSPKRRNGCSPKIESMKRKNRCYGFVVGHRVITSPKNSMICNGTANNRSHVNHVLNPVHHAHIRCQRYAKNLPNWSANEYWNRWSSFCRYFSLFNSPARIRCDRSLYRFSKHTTAQSHQTKRQR